MATQPRFDTREISTDGGRRGDGGRFAEEPQMRDLLKQLAAEGGDLVRNEVALAKLEFRDMAREITLDAAKLGGALVLVLTGALALVAAAIIGLGMLLGGMYALSALIIGALFLLIGGVLARSGMVGLKNPPKPEATTETIQENRAWAAREIREFREEIRS